MLPWELINKIAGQHLLDPKLVGAIILQESAGKTFAMRYEPQWRYHYNIKAFSSLVGCSEDTEFYGQMTSWGLMQVMGTVARELAFIGFFSELCNPEVGILYGCKKLRKLADRYSDKHDIVSAYNQGSPKKTPSGWYHNQKYVDSVFRHYRNVLNGAI